MKQVNDLMNSTLELKLEGLNFERFLQYVKSNNVTLYNLERTDYNALSFSLLKDDYKKLLKLRSFRNYKVTVLKTRGVYFVFKNLKTKIGLLCGLAISIALFAFFSMYTFNINVIGLESITKEDIVSFLKNYEIEVGKINNINNNEVELLLKENFEDISLVSVIKKGTNLVISIKEKEKINTDNYTEIVAPMNCMITKLEVNQGTALKKVGDFVRQGDTIIAAYLLDEKGSKQPVKPIAQIELDVWTFGKVEFETVKVTYEKTGKKLVDSYFMFNNVKLLTNVKGHDFEYVETKIFSENVFNNFFLPLHVTRITYYELKPKIDVLDFEENKARLMEESKALAYDNFPKDKEVLEETVSISQMGTKFIVQTALKCQLIITKQ